MGVSIGVERIFAVLEARLQNAGQKLRTCQTEVYVASAQKNLSVHRMKVLTELWNNGIKVIFTNDKFKRFLPFIY